jgi:hypothetical protein
MSLTLNIIPENPDLVLIGLNPTEEAIANKAVFSRDNAFWNILIKAGIIDEQSTITGVKLSDVPLNDRATEVFQKQHYQLDGLITGFADLLPLISEKFSTKVVVPLGAAKDLFKTATNLKNSKKIILMGQKVVDGFAQDYKSLTKWNDIPLTKSGTKDFGHIGDIVIENNPIKVFAMPFPVNNNVKDKHDLYKSVLETDTKMMGFISQQTGNCENCNSKFGHLDSLQSTNLICSKCKEKVIFCKSCKNKGCKCGGKLLDPWDINPDVIF